MISIKIVTPEGIVYTGEEIKSVTIPTTTGIITVLKDHVPLVSVLQAGELIIKKGSGKDEDITNVAVSSGIVHVEKGSIIQILADTAERAEEIDIERAEEARKRAEEYLKEKLAVEDFEYAQLQAKIEKELARISVGRKYRRIHNTLND